MCLFYDWSCKNKIKKYSNETFLSLSCWKRVKTDQENKKKMWKGMSGNNQDHLGYNYDYAYNVSKNCFNQGQVHRVPLFFSLD